MSSQGGLVEEERSCEEAFHAALEKFDNALSSGSGDDPLE
jgi:hypothetical protein